MSAGWRRGAVIAVTATVLSIAGSMQWWRSPDRAAARPSLAAQLEDLELRSGDLVFRRGRSLESRSVLAIDPEPTFSHVGLVRVSDGTTRIIHTLPVDGGAGGGVFVEPIVAFLAATEASAAGVYRLTDQAPEVGERAAAAAYRYALEGVPFDQQFDKEDDGALYCTELVWAAYRDAGVDLIGDDFVELRNPLRRGAYIMPSTLTKSPALAELRRVSE